MHNSGDYLTPAAGDGTLRFKKPILIYWAVLFGYKVFGFNYLASRILFLIAGSTVVWLTFELCLALARRPDVALSRQRPWRQT
jgi:4-amino-4-deoxy-L-arabinose transferase-like glycosyltransferase